MRSEREKMLAGGTESCVSGCPARPEFHVGTMHLPDDLIRTFGRFCFIEENPFRASNQSEFSYFSWSNSME